MSMSKKDTPSLSSNIFGAIEKIKKTSSSINTIKSINTTNQLATSIGLTFHKVISNYNVASATNDNNEDDSVYQVSIKSCMLNF